MKSVIIAIKDETILSKVRLSLLNEDIKYFYTSSSEETIRIAQDYDIAAAVLDTNLSDTDDKLLFESLLNINRDFSFIILFDENIKNIVDIYNSVSYCRLLDKRNLDLEQIQNIIDDAISAFINSSAGQNSINSINGTAKNLKTLHEMSDILNEKLNGYQTIIRIYNDCAGFVSNKTSEEIKNFHIYVDRIVNDFIQLYMVREPDFLLYTEKLNENFNKPLEKKYFRYISNCKDIDKSKKRDILLVIDVLTICFDLFFDTYRGKLELTSDRNNVYINAVYETRNLSNNSLDSDKISAENVLNNNTILKIVNSLINKYSSSCKFARNKYVYQFKAIFNNNL